MKELNEKLDELGRAFEQFKEANDAALKEMKTKGHTDPLLSAKVDKTNEEIGKLCDERKKIQEQIDQIQTALNRTDKGGAGKSEEEKAKQLKKDAFIQFIRYGQDRVAQELKSGLSVSDDTAGGFLVYPELDTEIIRNLAKVNRVRSIANVVTVSKGDALEGLRRTAGVTASWASEQGSNPSTVHPNFGGSRISLNEMRVSLSETAQVLEDAVIDIEAWLAMEAAESFANLEGDGFVNGTGVGKPRGILTYAAGTSDNQIEQVNSGAASSIQDSTGQCNGLIDMTFKLKAAYAKNGQFLLNRITTGSIRKLKDGQDRYIWSPGINGVTGPTIFGYEYIEDENMPTEGAGNLVIVFADFKRFYKIVDRLGTATIRDPYTSKPNIEFLVRRRVGGDVMIFEAGKILKCSA